MKLWKKLSLICGGILVLTVSVCTAIQLRQTRDTLYALAADQLHQKYNALSRSFQQMAGLYQEDSDTPAMQRALLHYCFSRLADSGCVLIVDEETVWSEMELQPEKLCPIEKTDEFGEPQVSMAGEDFLLEGSLIRLRIQGYPDCEIYVLSDIRPLKAVLRQMGLRFLAIGAFCILAGLGLIVFSVRGSMKPLQKLQRAAAQIAGGNYDRRVKVSSKDEVGTLALSFNHMADRVRQHVQELTQAAERQRLFTGAVTHEFKTPLTGILLSADSLQNTCMSEEEQQEALSSIVSQGKWLERLVQKLLKLLTLGQELTLETISVPELLESVRESTAEVLIRQGVSLDIQYSTETLRGDRDLLRSALVNLVDNACKASQPGQTVQLTAAARGIQVTDQGTGIPPDALAHVTEPFYMADRSRSKYQGGVGLGLALVQEITAAHGGTLEVESTPGAGTTVRIQLPS